MPEERWLPVVGWEGRYEVSDQGQVRSVPHFTPGRPNGSSPVLMPFKGRTLKAHTKPSGHEEVRLSDGPKLPTRSVHRLVLEAFVGPCPDGMEGCHNDGNPSNNRLENLRWDTRQANVLDKVRHGSHPFARRTHCPRGHEYTSANTYTPPSGGRRCKACRAEKRREKAAAR